jgi:hypothetical protein
VAADPNYHDAFWIGVITVSPVLLVAVLVVVTQTVVGMNHRSRVIRRPDLIRKAYRILYAVSAVTATILTALIAGGIDHLARESDAPSHDMAVNLTVTEVGMMVALAGTLLTTLGAGVVVAMWRAAGGQAEQAE